VRHAGVRTSQTGGEDMSKSERSAAITVYSLRGPVPPEGFRPPARRRVADTHLFAKLIACHGVLTGVGDFRLMI
jgi:hypothetical protein